jgi:hypothetical protein
MALPKQTESSREVLFPPNRAELLTLKLLPKFAAFITESLPFSSDLPPWIDRPDPDLI